MKSYGREISGAASVVLATSALLGGCGGGKVERHSSPEIVQSISGEQVFNVAKKYTEMIERLRKSVPLVPDVSNKRGCITLHHGYGEGPDSVTTNLAVEAKDGKSGYEFRVVEMKDRQGKASPSNVEDVSIERLKYTDCKGHGTSEWLDFTADNPEHLSGGNWDLQVAHGSLLRMIGYSYTTHPDTENTPLSPQVYSVFSREAENIIKAAREQQPVSHTLLPNVGDGPVFKGPAAQ